MRNERGPLARWARRKAEAKRSRGAAAPVVEEEGKAVPAARDAPADAGTDSGSGAGDKAPAGIAAEDLPDIDSLTAESDFTAFLKEGVPAELKRLALRKLWSSDPVLANLDGLVDYGEDYTRITGGIAAAAGSVAKAGEKAGEKARQAGGGQGEDGAPKEPAAEEAGRIVDDSPAAPESAPQETAARDDGETAGEGGDEDGDGRKPAGGPRKGVSKG